MQDENVLKITFSSLLLGVMRSKSLMQKDLSIMTGITHSAISKYLSGKALPRAQELVKLASVLGVSIDYLLGISTQPSEMNEVMAENMALKLKLNIAVDSLQATLNQIKP